MFLEIFSKTEVSDKQDIISYEDENLYLEAFMGDTQIISTAQELNELRESLIN